MVPLVHTLFHTRWGLTSAFCFQSEITATHWAPGSFAGHVSHPRASSHLHTAPAPSQALAPSLRPAALRTYCWCVDAQLSRQEEERLAQHVHVHLSGRTTRWYICTQDTAPSLLSSFIVYTLNNSLSKPPPPRRRPHLGRAAPAVRPYSSLDKAQSWHPALPGPACPRTQASQRAGPPSGSGFSAGSLA